MEKKKIQCDLSNVTISKDPNKMYITGCITKIGVPSGGVPCGAVSNLVFTQEAIEACAQSWVSTPLNAVDGWCNYVLSDHGYDNIGVCTKVWAEDDNLMARFVVWKDKFPELADLIVCGMDSLGFSIECYSTDEHMDSDGNVVVDAFEGSGCAILWKAKAAWGNTFISELAAARRKDNMKNEKKVATAAAAEEEQKVAPTKAAEEEEKPAEEAPAEEEGQEEEAADKFASLDAKLDALMTAIAGLTEAVAAANQKCADGEESEEEPPADDGEEEKKEEAADGEEEESEPEEEEKDEETKASKSKKNVPAPKTQYTAAKNPHITDGKDISEKIEKINASAMSPIAKLREITKLRMNH